MQWRSLMISLRCALCGVSMSAKDAFLVLPSPFHDTLRSTRNTTARQRPTPTRTQSPSQRARPPSPSRRGQPRRLRRCPTLTFSRIAPTLGPLSARTGTTGTIRRRPQSPSATRAAWTSLRLTGSPGTRGATCPSQSRWRLLHTSAAVTRLQPRCVRWGSGSTTRKKRPLLVSPRHE